QIRPRVWRHPPVYGPRTGQRDQGCLRGGEQICAGVQEHTAVAPIGHASKDQASREGCHAASADQCRQRRGGPSQEYEVWTETKLVGPFRRRAPLGNAAKSLSSFRNAECATVRRKRQFPCRCAGGR